MTPALAVERLSVRDAAGRALVAPFDLTLAVGGAATLVGESGAGKSLVCAAVAGTLPPGLLAAGRIWIGGRRAETLATRDRQALWARDLFLLPQEPWQALAPARRVLPQTADATRLSVGNRASARQAARGLLARVGLDPEADGPKRPWQLSGGMAQRVAVAAALGVPAPLVLVDEPTKGLDVARRAQVRDGLLTLRRDGRALLLVTHDLRLARQLGGELLVMRNGDAVERGEAAAVLAHPAHPFTRALADALPYPHGDAAPPPGPALVRTEAISLRAGRKGPPLVQGMTTAIGAGEVVGLCGPSGSGKTTLGDTLLGLRRVQAGRVAWRPDAARPAARQKLYQDPGAAFAPWRPLRASLADALAGTGRRRAALPGMAAPLLARMRLDPALLDRRPAEVSGGELQRIAIARTLLGEPLFLFADEPTSRLDPLTEREVLLCLAELAAGGTACLLASHDPDVLGAMARRVIRLDGSGGHEG